MLETGAALRVLVIEDNPYDAKIVTELFREIKNGGFALTIAETLEKAAAAYAECCADVILLDLNLPDSYGPATLTRAKVLFPENPIIVMTGFYEEQLGIELIKKGAQDYLVKGKITADWLGYSVKYSLERARLENKLRSREGRLRTILEKSPDGYLVVRHDGSVAFANRGAELLFGRDRESLLKQPFFLEADTEKNIETELLRPDGKKIPLELRAVDIMWDTAISKLVILRDLNPVRALERSRDEFISMISHELRSPLTVIKESMQLFFDGALGPATEKQKEILKIGLDNSARLSRLIDALLDITKIEAGVMPMYLCEADLGNLLEETAKEYSYLAAANKLTLAKDLPDSTVRIFCDVEQIRQVLVNLVSNALKFTPSGGLITLSLRSMDGTAIACVENSGPGIAEDDLPKLFNKFAQLGNRLPSAAKGTGLGLAISKGIVEMHKGRIWVESQPGKGCGFYVRLPLLDFDRAAREMVRREIELSGAQKRHFSAVTLDLRSELVKNGTGLAAKAETLIKARLCYARVILKRAEGEFTLLIPDSDAKNGCKVCTFLESNLAQPAGPAAGGGAELTHLLSYPEDFTDEDTFVRKLAAARARTNA